VVAALRERAFHARQRHHRQHNLSARSRHQLDGGEAATAGARRVRAHGRSCAIRG
jgi:hypothetical protein